MQTRTFLMIGWGFALGLFAQNAIGAGDSAELAISLKQARVFYATYAMFERGIAGRDFERLALEVFPGAVNERYIRSLRIPADAIVHGDRRSKVVSHSDGGLDLVVNGQRVRFEHGDLGKSVKFILASRPTRVSRLSLFESEARAIVPQVTALSAVAIVAGAGTLGMACKGGYLGGPCAKDGGSQTIWDELTKIKPKIDRVVESAEVVTKGALEVCRVELSKQAEPDRGLKHFADSKTARNLQKFEELDVYNPATMSMRPTCKEAVKRVMNEATDYRIEPERFHEACGNADRAIKCAVNLKMKFLEDKCLQDLNITCGNRACYTNLQDCPEKLKCLDRNMDKLQAACRAELTGVPLEAGKAEAISKPPPATLR